MLKNEHKLELRFIVSRVEAVQARIKLEIERASDSATYETIGKAMNDYMAAYELYRLADNDLFECQVRAGVENK